MSDINSMQVYFSMTEKDLLDMTKTAGGLHAAIKDYPPVKLQLADGTVYGHDGRVAAVSGVIDQSTGSVSIRADFPNPEHLSRAAVQEASSCLMQALLPSLFRRKLLYRFRTDTSFIS